MKARIEQALKRRDLGLAVRRLIIDLGNELEAETIKWKTELEDREIVITELRAAVAKEQIACLHDAMPDSEIPKFFKRATSRKYKNELAINDIRRMLMLFWNERI